MFIVFLDLICSLLRIVFLLQQVKVEPATATLRDVLASVAANVTVLASPQTSAPVVIAPVDTNMSNSSQINLLPGNALQAISSLLSGQSGNINIAEYISALVSQATVQVLYKLLFALRG